MRGIRAGSAASSQRLCQGPTPLRPRNLLEDRVLERFRRAQTNHGLRLDFARLARLRVAAHARLAVRFHGAADVRNYELTRWALAFSYRELEEFFKKESCGFLGCIALFGHVRHDFGFAHRLGHLVSLSSSFFHPPPSHPRQPRPPFPHFL